MRAFLSSTTPGQASPRVLGWLVPVCILASCEAAPQNVARHWAARDGAIVELEGDGGAAGTSPEDPAPSDNGGSSGQAAGGAGGSAASTGGRGGSTTPPDPGTPGSGGASAGDPPPRTGADASADGPPASMPPPASGPVACAMTVSITTTATGRNYSPRNIGAIWIADAAGKFVKTLTLWAGRRVNHLEEWNQVTSDAGLSRNTVDAVTGATSGNHGAHKGTWDCSDAKKARVPLGKYQLCMEMTESNSAGPKACVPFDNAGTAFHLAPADAANFKARQIDYKPL